MLPTMVFFSEDTANAQDTPANSYWQRLASTDFTTTEWEGSGSDYNTKGGTNNHTVVNGDKKIGWGLKYGTHSTNEVIRNKIYTEIDSTHKTEASANNGVCVPWVTNDCKYQAMLYMNNFDGQTSNTIFNGISNFKIDLAFSFTDKAKCNTGQTLDGTKNDVPLIKLAKDSNNKYSHRSQYNHQSNYFIQTAWGERSVDDDDYYVDGGTTETEGTTTGGKWAITTKDNNSSSVLEKNTIYHYVVYVADQMLGCYVTDDAGNVVINYNPIELGDYSFTPADISSIYLGASEFNWAGKYDIENIAYKSIEIYKGVDTHTYDSSRDKFLYAYFTGNSDAGEKMHYAVSSDGINFEAVSSGTSVWNPSSYGATETYPSTDSAPYSDSIQTGSSGHVRDSYAFIGEDGKDYIIATDLDTNNGQVYSNNSRFYVWKMDNFADITETKPISIDTSMLPGMDAVTGGTSGTHKTVKKAWAPQAIWDPDVGKYMLYWTVGADGIDTQLYYTYTSDFKSDFTTVKRLLHPDFDGKNITNHIDADITYHNGLYYCYFKNEDGSGTGAKRIWYSVAPHANGPYTDYELVETGYASEGPQIYEVANGSYMLMIDGYGDHTYHMYAASNPYDFSERYGGVITNRETTTNITSLSPRHGSIVRITDAEYQKLKKLAIGDEVRYQWENALNNTSDGSTQHDSAGHDYVVAYVGNGITTGEGVLTTNNAGVYTQDTEVQNFIASDVYSVTFDYKSNGSTARDDNHSIFSISRSDNVSNYVRLTTNGKFIVNNSQVAVSGNCSDGTTTRAAKFSSAVTDTANFHTFTVTSDGVLTSLIIDDEFICQTINGTDIPNTLWLTFGWARATGIEDNRLSAQFGEVIFKNVETETDKEDELFNALKPASVPTSGTFNKAAYHRAVTADSDYYSNLVYCSGGPSPADWYHSGNADNTNFTDEISDDHLRYKYATPANVVGVYDGTTHPSYPIIVETYMKSQASSEIMHFIQPFANSDESWNARTIALRHATWTGYGTNWEAWPTSSSNSFAAEAAKQYNHTDFNASGDNNDAKGKNGIEASAIRGGSEHRFWKNAIEHRGSGAGENDNYLETISNPSLLKGHSSKGGTGNRYFYYQTRSANTNFYVLNYEPVKNILNGTVKVKIEGSTSGNVTIASLYNSDSENRWMYTKESYTHALYAMKLLNDCNPNNYNYNSDPAGQALQCGKDIKKAIDEFNKIDLKKNKFNITYRMADGTTKAEVVTAGNNLVSVPSNTADYHIFDTEQHKKNCQWNSVSHDAVPSGASAYSPTATPSTSVMPKANTVYTETGTVEDCTLNIVAASGDTNGYKQYDCEVCGYQSIIEWDDQSTNWNAYDAALENASSVTTDPDYASTYTTSSKAAYTAAYNAATTGVTDGDKTKSASYITGKTTALTNAVRLLNHVANFSDLDTTVTTATYSNARATNNASSGAQLYTYNSWVNFASSYDGGNEYHNYNAAARADTPMYAVDANNYVKDGTHGTTLTYSDDQQSINGYNSEIPTRYTALAAVDANEKYNSFNAAYAVACAVNSEKYNATGLAQLNAAKAQYNNVYHTLQSDEVEAYNSYTSGGHVAGEKIKNSSNVDTCTGDMLTALNTIEDSNNKATYVKQLDVSYTVKKDNAQPSTVQYGDSGAPAKPYYGDTLSFAVTNEQKAEGDSVVFSVQKYEKYENGEFVNATGATKVNTNGNSISQVVNTPMAVTAKITSGGTSSGVKLSIQNIYGKLIDVMYVAEGYPTVNSNGDLVLNSNDDVYDAPNVAFYSFEKWIKVTEGDGAVTYRAQYTVSGEMCNFSAVSGTITNSSSGTVTRAKKDTKLTLTYSGDNFYAWASKPKKSDAPNLADDSCYDVKKYQIVSYSPSYWFYATTDEDFYPVIKSGDDYIVKTGESSTEALTPDNVDSITYLDFGDMTTEEKNTLKTTILKAKLDQRAPFISISYAKVTDESSKQRFNAAMRMTYYDSNSDQQNDITNATLSTVFARKYSSYITKNKGEYLFVQGASGVSTIKITNVLKNGQFSVTATYPTTDSGKAAIRGCVEYPLNYNNKTVSFSDYTTINPLTYVTTTS